MSDSKIYRTGIRGALDIANRMAKARDKDEAARIAVAENDLEWLERILNDGADINATKGDYKTTLVMEAAVRGHVEAIEMLLDKGADVDMADLDGWTALMGATVQGHLEAVTVLLEHGANVNSRNHANDTSLIMARGLHHDEIAQALLEHGATD